MPIHTLPSKSHSNLQQQWTSPRYEFGRGVECPADIDASRMHDCLLRRRWDSISICRTQDVDPQH
jgi:hypothetical protein